MLPIYVLSALLFVGAAQSAAAPLQDSILVGEESRAVFEFEKKLQLVETQSDYEKKLDSLALLLKQVTTDSRLSDDVSYNLSGEVVNRVVTLLQNHLAELIVGWHDSRAQKTDEYVDPEVERMYDAEIKRTQQLLKSVRTLQAHRKAEHKQRTLRLWLPVVATVGGLGIVATVAWLMRRKLPQSNDYSLLGGSPKDDWSIQMDDVSGGEGDTHVGESDASDDDGGTLSGGTLCNPVFDAAGDSGSDGRDVDHGEARMDTGQCVSDMMDDLFSPDTGAQVLFSDDNGRPLMGTTADGSTHIAPPPPVSSTVRAHGDRAVQLAPGVVTERRRRDAMPVARQRRGSVESSSSGSGTGGDGGASESSVAWDEVLSSVAQDGGAASDDESVDDKKVGSLSEGASSREDLPHYRSDDDEFDVVSQDDAGGGSGSERDMTVLSSQAADTLVDVSVEDEDGTSGGGGDAQAVARTDVFAWAANVNAREYCEIGQQRNSARESGGQASSTSITPLSEASGSSRDTVVLDALLTQLDAPASGGGSDVSASASQVQAAPDAAAIADLDALLAEVEAGIVDGVGDADVVDGVGNADVDNLDALLADLVAESEEGDAGAVSALSPPIPQRRDSIRVANPVLVQHQHQQDFQFSVVLGECKGAIKSCEKVAKTKVDKRVKQALDAILAFTEARGHADDSQLREYQSHFSTLFLAAADAQEDDPLMLIATAIGHLLETPVNLDEAYSKLVQLRDKLNALAAENNKPTLMKLIKSWMRRS